MPAPLVCVRACVRACVRVCVLSGGYFQFPTLNGSKFITDRNSDVDLPFTVVETCKTSGVKLTSFTIAKENEKRSPRCMFFYKPECTAAGGSSCQCPEDGSGLYHFLLPADPSNNGTWVWLAKPPVVQQSKIHILVIGE